MSEIDNEEIISQIIGIGKCCEQRGDEVSKYDKSCHICSLIL